MKSRWLIDSTADLTHLLHHIQKNNNLNTDHKLSDQESAEFIFKDQFQASLAIVNRTTNEKGTHSKLREEGGGGGRAPVQTQHPATFSVTSKRDFRIGAFS